MINLVTSTLSLILSMTMQLSTIGAVQMAPEDAATEFMDGLTAGQDQVVARYIDNKYIKMIESTGDEKITDEMYGIIFGDFSYEIVDTASENNVAVAKINIKTKDFSGAMDMYDKESYKYVTKHLYDDSVRDKGKLNKKCLEIYVDTLENISQNGEDVERTIYLPMEINDHYGWEIIADNQTMTEIFGNLKLPDSE